MIKAGQVKELRESTGAGMMDCKRALTETNGDLEKAVIFLREHGMAAAAKKEGRATKEGRIEAYIHAGAKLGVLIEVDCETDFVAKTENYQHLCRELAMQVAAAKPLFVDREQVPQEQIEREREIYRNQALAEGKPEKILDRIVDGKVEKFYQDNCLVDQLYIRDPNMKIKDLIKETIAKLGENIIVKRFVRLQLGEE
jgi:elongation factor Ts